MLFAATFLTGLSAGFFYAWSVSVIPGTLKITDNSYMETMQSINRAVLNPAFFIIFFGSLILLTTSSVLHYQNGPVFWLIVASTVIYLVGTFGVTAFGNVPLNNELEALNLQNLSTDRIELFRQQYELKWNRYHIVRTVFAVISFLLSLLAIFSHSKLLNL